MLDAKYTKHVVLKIKIGPSLKPCLTFRKCDVSVFMPDTGERMVVGTKKMLLLHEDFVKLYPYAMSVHVRLCNLR